MKIGFYEDIVISVWSESIINRLLTQFATWDLKIVDFILHQSWTTWAIKMALLFIESFDTKKKKLKYTNTVMLKIWRSEINDVFLQH